MPAIIKNFLEIAKVNISYNLYAKRTFHRRATKVIKLLAKEFGYTEKDYDLRHNQGGSAVSGEITLHSDTIYVQFAQFGSYALNFYWRTCNGRKDYTGDRNIWEKWESLQNLSLLVTKMQQAVREKKEEIK